jgi:Bacterial pre-peptidase C-terminal domain
MPQVRIPLQLFHKRHFAQLFATVCIQLILVSRTHVSAADPPKVERLFPPGGARGSVVEAKVVGAAGDGPLQVWSNHGQLTFAFSEKSDAVSVTIPEDAIAGVHLLRFHNEHGATDLRPFVVGLIPELLETEPNNRLIESTAVESAAATVNGVLQKSGDVDLFAVTLKRGTTLVAIVEANQHLGSPMDASLELLDENGVVLAANDDDHGVDPLIAYDVAADGTYYVRIYAFPAAPNSTINLAGAANYVYRLSISSGPVVSHTIPAVVNSSGETTCQLHGWNVDEQLPVVVVPGATENTFMIVDNLTIPYRVGIVHHGTESEVTGSPQTLAVPSSVTGVISVAGEEDTWHVNARKGQNVTLRVDARSMYSLLDPVLRIENDQGKVIKEADDRSKQNLDAEATVTWPADGRYSVKINDRYGSGGERHFYVLSCEETLPAFSATLKSSVFVLPDDKALELPVSIDRVNGFDGAITASVESLPEGLLCESVVSESKGDSAKSVTLKITRQENASASFQGAIRIRCVVESSDTDRFATAPIENLQATTTNIWLTVPASETSTEEPASSGDPSS